MRKTKIGKEIDSHCRICKEALTISNVEGLFERNHAVRYCDYCDINARTVSRQESKCVNYCDEANACYYGRCKTCQSFQTYSEYMKQLELDEEGW